MSDMFRKLFTTGYDKVEEGVTAETSEENIPEQPAAQDDGMRETINELNMRLALIESSLDEIKNRPAPQFDVSNYVTTKDQARMNIAAIEKMNVEASNKAFMQTMRQIATMREDFFKLCEGMRDKIDTMTPREVLSSFEAYSVDMENTLTDGGVFIGHFPFDTVDTKHQRIIGTIPTDDPTKNGAIVERLTEGYKLGDHVLVKEGVEVYKYCENAAELLAQMEAEKAAEEEAKAKAGKATKRKTTSRARKTTTTTTTRKKKVTKEEEE